MITDGADSTCKVWDLSNSNKIPSSVYFDTESKIISSDFRPTDSLYICLDEDGHFILRKIKEEKESSKIKLSRQNYKYLKFNPMNDFQYFIGSEESFKIYDIRTHLEIETIEEFKNSINIFNDSNNYMLIREDGLNLYNYSSHKIEKVKEWINFSLVTHFNMSYINPDVLLVGNEGGDVYYSKFEN